MTICAANCAPSPASACMPTIRQMPTIPATTPTSFRDVTASWRVIANVRKNVNIGAVELRMVATPASSARAPHATIVQGMTLLRHAWNRKRRQFAASAGSADPATAHDRDQQQPGDQRAARNQGDRRNRRHRDLQECVGRAPQRRERQQQRQFVRDFGMLLLGLAHFRDPGLDQYQDRTLQPVSAMIVR